MTRGKEFLPPRYGWKEANTFGAFTVSTRFPRIVDDLTKNGVLDKAALKKTRTWIDGLQKDSLALNDFEPNTCYYFNWMRELEGCPYGELPFIYIEFLFYNIINYVMLISLMKQALSGNIYDLSNSRVKDLGQSHLKIIQDDISAFARRFQIALRSGQSVTVNLIADNAGEELIADIILCNYILYFQNVQVVLHLKPWPMFVSDATLKDFSYLIELMHCSPIGSFGKKVSEHLDQRLSDGRLEVQSSNDWGEPRDYCCLNKDLGDILQKNPFNISKGDLNYRRFFQDRQWPHSTAISDAAQGIAFSAFLLRVIKSDLLVGCSDTTLQQMDDDWAFSSRYSVAQDLN